MPTKALTNDGRSGIRDFLQSELDDMAVGTDDSEVSRTDTTLGNEVIRKAFADESDSDIGTARFDMRLLTTDANGVDLQELGLFNGAGEMWARIVYADIRKTNDFEIEFEVSAEVQNP